jgi:hypothetical protein
MSLLQCECRKILPRGCEIPEQTWISFTLKGVRYDHDEWRMGLPPTGKEEIFNQAHSSLRSVIERSFGVLKMKWRILLAIPSYPERKQSKIILACCGLHNFIKENDCEDIDFNMVEADDTFGFMTEDDDEAEQVLCDEEMEDDMHMNAVRDEIATACLLATSI